jgi:hypothetical protein
MHCSSIRRDIVQPHSPLSVDLGQNSLQLCPLTAPQPDSLPVLLKLGDKLITLLNNIVVLLILIIWSVSLDDSLPGYSVDGAGNTPGRDELSQVTEVRLVLSCVIELLLHTGPRSPQRRQSH